MGRFPQKSRDSKGSLRNIQLLTNLYPDLINGQLKQRFPELQEETIEWKSPVESDDYAEYRDGAFIELMKLKQDEIKLEEFWPSYGPQWDALALTNKGSVILVEAKANLPEIISSSSGNTVGLSVTELIPVSIISCTCLTTSLVAPCTCGMQRKE